MPTNHDHDGYAQAQAAENSPDYNYYYSGRAPGLSGTVPIPPTSRIQFQPQPLFYSPPNPSASKMYPEDHQGPLYQRRSRSLPPLARRRRSYRECRDSSFFRYKEDPHDPVKKAQQVFNHTFSNSNSGLEIGILGAIVGGLIAREASEATTHRSRGHGSSGSDKGPLISTIVGAAVGGLAANALEKRIEVARVKTAEKEDAWERKWGRDSRGRRIDRDHDFGDAGRRESRPRSSDEYYDDVNMRYKIR